MSVRTVRKESERKELEKEMLQKVLMGLLRDEENRYCADCEAKGPRWASWNIGIFVCIRCAGIHRKLGVHISKVKSINLDAWTPEQVASMCCMGNSVAKAVYEHSLPEHFRRPQSDQALEAFIRAKYEQKRYIMRDWQRPEPNVKNLPCYEELMELRNHGTVRTRPNTATASGGGAHVTLPPPTMLTKPAAAAPPPQSVTSAPNLLDFDASSSATTTTTQASVPSNMNDLLGLNSEPAPRSQEKSKATSDLEDLFGDFTAPQTSPSAVSDNNRAFDQKLSQIYELCKTEPQRPMPMNGFNTQPQMPMSGLTAQMQGMTMQQPFMGGAPMMAPAMSMQQPRYAAQQTHPMAQAQNMQHARPQQPHQSVQDIMSNPFFSQLNVPHSTAPPKAQATSDNNNALANLFG